MRTLWKAVIIAVLGTVALLVAMSALEPDVPTVLVAVYNLWLLGTVVVLVVGVIGAFLAFFEKITGGKRLL